MFQASSLLVNTEIINIPSDVIGAFALTALKIGLVAFVVIGGIALFAGKDNSWMRNPEPTPIRKMLGVAALFGLTGFAFFFGMMFFAQAAILTDNLSKPWGVVVGTIQTIMLYAVLILDCAVTFLVLRFSLSVVRKSLRRFRTIRFS